MSITLYFAKLNLATDEIYRIYKDPKKKTALKFALAESLKKESQWVKTSFHMGEDGTPQVTKIEYKLSLLSLEEDLSCAEGWVYKKSTLHYNTLDERTGSLTSKSVKNTEAIRFCFDLENELVGYDTKARFGYKEFLEAFAEIINQGLEDCDPPLLFTINLCSKGISLSDIKKALGGIGQIQELQFKIQPPNPQKELLEQLQELGQSRLADMRQANVTHMETTIRSSGGAGLNLNSELIKEELEKLQGIHHNLTPEEANKNGYIRVRATANSGQQFSSEEAGPFKKVIDCLDEIKEACKGAFTELLS